MQPYFSNPASQHYALSHVEFYAHALILHGGRFGPLITEHPQAFFFQDRWKDAYSLEATKAKDTWAVSLVQLLTDVQQRRVTTLEAFYSRFKKLKYPDKGKALVEGKARTARREAAKESKGEDFLDNNQLYHRLYIYAKEVAHRGLLPDELKAGLSDLIEKYHGKTLPEPNRQELLERLTKRIALMERQLNAVEAELLRMRDEAGKPSSTAARALWLYGLIRSECEIGGTVIKTHAQWAELTPYTKNNIGAAMGLLAELGAIELLQPGVGRIPKGSRKQRQSAQWKRLR